MDRNGSQPISLVPEESENLYICRGIQYTRMDSNQAAVSTENRAICLHLRTDCAQDAEAPTNEHRLIKGFRRLSPADQQELLALAESFCGTRP